MRMWVLTTHLDDTHQVTKWQTWEGAKANLERLLKPQGKDMHIPTGWTALTLEGRKGD